MYAVHIEYGPYPLRTHIDYIAEFTVTMPILSLTGTIDSLLVGGHIVQVYCVHTQAMRHYALNLSRCLPPPLQEHIELAKPGSNFSCALETTSNWYCALEPLQEHIEFEKTGSISSRALETSSSNSYCALEPPQEHQLPEVTAPSVEAFQKTLNQCEMQQMVANVKSLQLNEVALCARFDENAEHMKLLQDGVDQISSTIKELKKELASVAESVTQLRNENEEHKELLLDGMYQISSTIKAFKKELASVAESVTQVHDENEENIKHTQDHLKNMTNVITSLKNEELTTMKNELISVKKSVAELPSKEFIESCLVEVIPFASKDMPAILESKLKKPLILVEESEAGLVSPSVDNPSSSATFTQQFQRWTGDKSVDQQKKSFNSNLEGELVGDRPNPLVLGVEGASSRANEVPLDTRELSRLISEQKFEEAFVAALKRRRSVSLVSWLCSLVNPEVLSKPPIPLSQCVLLALLHLFACHIKKEEMSRNKEEMSRNLEWMKEVALAINPTDSMIAALMVRILEQVYGELIHLRNLSTDITESKRILTIMHIVLSMLSNFK